MTREITLIIAAKLDILFKVLKPRVKSLDFTDK